MAVINKEDGRTKVNDTEELLKNNIIVTSVDKVLNWARGNSLWSLTFGLACCAIEMIGATQSRYDLSRIWTYKFIKSN